MEGINRFFRRLNNEDLDHFDSNSTDEDSEAETEQGAPTCAICLEPQTSKRSLVVLPCCGGENEVSSSMRFCENCIKKYLRRNGTYNGSMITGECPRCRHLIVSKNNKVSKASVLQMLWFTGKKDSGAYRLHLVTMAWCHCNYLPAEILDLMDSSRVSQDYIRHLCQWGLLRKHKDDVYWVDVETQKELRSWCSRYLEGALLDWELKPVECKVDFEYVRNRTVQCIMVACVCAASGYAALRKYKIARCIRLWNRSLTLLIVGARILPNVEHWSHWWDGWLATGLNLFFLVLLSKILVKAFWILIDLACGWLAAKVIGLWICPPAKPWKRWLRNVSMLYVGGSLLYYSYLKVLLFIVWKTGSKQDEVAAVE